MKERPGQDFFPFSVSLDGQVAEGLHSDVLNLGKEWVLKQIKPAWQQGNWQERLMQDYELLCKYLGKFIPPTGLILCSEDGTKSTLVIAQKKIRGTLLRNLSWEDLNNTLVVANFIELRKCIQQMYMETGLTPDLHGGTRNLLRQYDFKYSNNLSITREGQIWWTDVDRLGPLWSKSWIGGRLHMAHMMRSFCDFIKKLERNHQRKTAVH